MTRRPVVGLAAVVCAALYTVELAGAATGAPGALDPLAQVAPGGVVTALVLWLVHEVRELRRQSEDMARRLAAIEGTPRPRPENAA